MTGRKRSTTRKTQPALEALEGRRLLSARIIAPNGKPINDQDLARYQVQKANNVPLSDRRIAYTTPQGTKVQLTLFGFGTLAGTTVRPDGALDLVYDNTQATSKIVGHVSGGNGRAKIASIRDADIPVGSPSSVGGDPINVVNFKKFDLIAGGRVNIGGGVGTLALRSAGPNTRIDVSPLPTSTTTASTNPTAQDETAILDTTSGSFNVSGQQSQSVTIISTNAANTTPPAPTGVALSIPNVNAAPRSVPLGNAQVFGFDPTAMAIVRFDAVTGANLQTIPVPAGGTPLAGVGLGRNNGNLVALVGSATTITAVDAVSGAVVGQFSVANLASAGLTEIDALGSSDVRTFVADSQTGPDGLIQRIDVTASLASGQAVPIGLPYSPAREFDLSGGLTGLAGSEAIYASGAAHFDSFVPDRVQAGVLTFRPVGTVAVETRRTALAGVGTPYIDAGTPGQVGANPIAALGSIGPNLALVSTVIGGKNQVVLLAPTNLVPQGLVSLDDANRLAGLSESFHPELRGGAIVNVRGNLLNFIGTQATGLVINAEGAVNLVAIKKARDSAFLGQPLNHVAIAKRQNVTLRSTPRGANGTDTNGGVKLSAAVAKTGILSQP